MTFEQLEDFYWAVARLTNEHDSIRIEGCGLDVDLAVVSPKDLDAELRKVDPQWSKHETERNKP